MKHTFKNIVHVNDWQLNNPFLSSLTTTVWQRIFMHSIAWGAILRKIEWLKYVPCLSYNIWLVLPFYQVWKLASIKRFCIFRSSSKKKVIYNLYICTHGIFKCGMQNNDYRHLIEVALNVCPSRHFRSLFKQCCDVKQRTQTYTTLTRDEKLWQNLHEWKFHQKWMLVI